MIPVLVKIFSIWPHLRNTFSSHLLLLKQVKITNFSHFKRSSTDNDMFRCTLLEILLLLLTFTYKATPEIWIIREVPPLWINWSKSNITHLFIVIHMFIINCLKMIFKRQKLTLFKPTVSSSRIWKIKLIYDAIIHG